MILKQIIWCSVLTVFTSILLENFLKYFIISYQLGFPFKLLCFIILWSIVARIVFPSMEYQLSAKSLSVLCHYKILLGICYLGLIWYILLLMMWAPEMKKEFRSLKNGTPCLPVTPNFNWRIYWYYINMMFAKKTHVDIFHYLNWIHFRISWLVQIFHHKSCEL